MKLSKNIFYLVGAYIAIRLFSLVFTPATPLWAQSPVNSLVSFFILALANFWIYKNDERGWYIVLLEIILGGSGGYLKVFGTSLRTCLLISSVAIFFYKKIKNEGIQFIQKFGLKGYAIFSLLAVAVIAALRGLSIGHAHGAVVADLIPYFFLLYYFPLTELWLSEDFRKLGKQAIAVAIIGNATMIGLTQLLLSTHIVILQDYYYHWYRDVALGKITDLGFNFYRLVLNEHLLLVPLLIYFIGDSIKNKLSAMNTAIISCLLFILGNNLTRIYLLALAVGILFLFDFKKWKRWVVISALSAFTFLTLFSTTHLLATRGNSFGLEFFGIRLQSIAAPQIEDSSLSRLLLLPKILEKIKQHPVIGNGLGDTVTVYSPVFKTNITTTHFDWGYLEILAEMGLCGLLAWLGIILLTAIKIIQEKHKYNRRILLAILLAFLTINITSPALFHIFGTILFILILSPIGQKYSHSAGGIVLGPDGKIILVNSIKDRNWWTPPKGRVEDGEDLITAAKREIAEESGIEKLEYIKTLGSFYHLLNWEGKLVFKKITLLLFKTTQTKLGSRDPHNPQASWFTIEQAVEKMHGEEYKKFFTKIKHDLI